MVSGISKPQSRAVMHRVRSARLVSGVAWASSVDGMSASGGQYLQTLEKFDDGVSVVG